MKKLIIISFVTILAIPTQAFALTRCFDQTTESTGETKTVCLEFPDGDSNSTNNNNLNTGQMVDDSGNPVSDQINLPDYPQSPAVPADGNMVPEDGSGYDSGGSEQ